MQKHVYADLKRQYPVVMQAAFVLALAMLIAASRAGWSSGDPPDLTPVPPEPEELEKPLQTEHVKPPPPPPLPVVPIPVPDDRILDEDVIEFTSEPDPGERLPLPPPPRDREEERAYPHEPFERVEVMPEMIGGPNAIYTCIRYPEIPRRAGIQGTVYIQFVVDEEGSVSGAEVLRSPNAALSEEALRCIAKLRFTPGMQRDRPVMVRMTLPVRFRLN